MGGVGRSGPTARAVHTAGLRLCARSKHLSCTLCFCSACGKALSGAASGSTYTALTRHTPGRRTATALALWRHCRCRRITKVRIVSKITAANTFGSCITSFLHFGMACMCACTNSRLCCRAPRLATPTRYAFARAGSVCPDWEVSDSPAGCSRTSFSGVRMVVRNSQRLLMMHVPQPAPCTATSTALN